MPDSKRLAALKALTAYLETEVSVDNGYQHNLAGAVFRGRLRYGADDPDTMVAILEAPDADRNHRTAGMDDGARYSSEQWLLLIQGWTPDDKRNPTDPAYNLMADVKKAIAKLNVDGLDPATGAGVENPNFRLGGLIGNIVLEPGVVRPPDELSAQSFFWLRANISFQENVNDPYELNG